MSESIYPLQPLGDTENDAAKRSGDDKAASFQEDEQETTLRKDDENTPLRDDETALLSGNDDNSRPSIQNRVSKAFRRVPYPSPKLFALWILCIGLLLLHMEALRRWPTGDYGVGVLRESMDCGSRGEAFMAFLVQLPLNGLATILVYALGCARSSMRLNGTPLIPLQIVPFLMTIPTHLLYNSLIFRSISAYDSYEVLASDAFLHHNSTPFDLSILSLYPTNGRVDPLRDYYNMTPPGLESLTDSVMQLQNSLITNQSQTQWKNLSLSNCLNRYKEGTYSSFSNVLLITNYTSPSTGNNSALELTILSGQAGPKHQNSQSLVALCPESFFTTHNETVPATWKYVPKDPSGLFDAYAPKKFPVKDENVFVTSCFSQKEAEKCRLLYSPLVLRIATICLMVTVGCMTFAVLFCGWSREKGWDFDEMDPEIKGNVVIFGSLMTFVTFVVQLFVMGFSAAAQREPSSKSDQRWLLNAFCVINVVQLLDTICETFVILKPKMGLYYAPASMLWHWFLSGVFSMQLSDRFIITSSLPRTTIIPCANLTSVWFKPFFKWVLLIGLAVPFLPELALILVAFFLCAPFALRVMIHLLVATEGDM